MTLEQSEGEGPLYLHSRLLFPPARKNLRHPERSEGPLYLHLLLLLLLLSPPRLSVILTLEQSEGEGPLYLPLHLSLLLLLLLLSPPQLSVILALEQSERGRTPVFALRTSPLLFPSSLALIPVSSQHPMDTDVAHVYILANGFKCLYTGVTSRLVSRIREHKQHLDPNSFTTRYHIDQLVWYEEHLSVVKAIAREKQIKGWLRIKKLRLIIETNPTWRDLSSDLLTMPQFAESLMRPPTTF